MDLDHLDFLKGTRPTGIENEIELMLSYDPETRFKEIPDPMGCQQDYFDHVAGMIAAAIPPMIDQIARRLGLG